eukprot:2676053-Pleurochrysis_carterae.AAC.1
MQRYMLECDSELTTSIGQRCERAAEHKERLISFTSPGRRAKGAQQRLVALVPYTLPRRRRHNLSAPGATRRAG